MTVVATGCLGNGLPEGAVCSWCFDHGLAHCPICNANGEVVVAEDRWRHPQDPERRLEICLDCLGAGVVDPGTARRLHRKWVRGWR